MQIFYFLLIFTLTQSGLWAVEYINSQDQMRCKVYADTRQENKAQPYTNAISNVLTNHHKIDYNRQATDQDREIIYKAMFGTVIVHQKHSYNFAYLNDSRYQRHTNVLKLVDELARTLWQGVLRGEYIHSLDQIDSDLIRARFIYNIQDPKKLLTENFVKWFYESLESYRHELNFLAGAATLEWFEKVSKQYSNGVDIEDSNLKIIFDEKGAKYGIYKALVNPKDNARNRQIKAEYMSWLLAKAAGLHTVVNPVIPVRFIGGDLVISPYHYEGTIEPFVGVVVNQPVFGLTKTVENYGSDMESFLTRSLSYCGYLSVSFSKTFTLPKNHYALQFFGKTTQQKVQDTFFFMPMISSLNSYFKEGSSSSFSLKCQFFQTRAVDTKQKFKDLQFFNQKISVNDLVDLIVFWHLTLQYDMNPSNIIYKPTSDGRIVPTVIDYDVSLGCHNGIIGRVPSVHMLKQAKESIPFAAKQKIQQISEAKLKQVMHTYQQTTKQWDDQTKNFDSLDTNQLAQRLKNIKAAVSKTTTTVRQVIHDLLPDHMSFNNPVPLMNYEDALQFAWKEMLHGHYKICQELKCSAVTPILQSFFKYNSSSLLGKKNDEVYTSDVLYFYALDYVFAADWQTFQEGENNKINLKGYLAEPFRVVY